MNWSERPAGNGVLWPRSQSIPSNNSTCIFYGREANSQFIVSALSSAIRTSWNAQDVGRWCWTAQDD